MTTHRFFVNKDSFDEDCVVITDQAIVNQISYVLRLKKDDKIIVLDGTGFEYEILLKDFGKKCVKGLVISKTQNKNESELQVFLYQGLTNTLEKFEWVLQKGTELGVQAFVPLITDRIKRNFLPKKDRLLRIIKEAAEQSERAVLPALLDEISFEDAVAKCCNDKKALNLFCYERGGVSVDTVMKSVDGKFSTINIFVGPEGGFCEKEIDLINSLGAKFHMITLGSRILRTETAAIAILAKILI